MRCPAHAAPRICCSDRPPHSPFAVPAGARPAPQPLHQPAPFPSPLASLAAVELSVTKEGIKFSTSGDIGSANVICRQTSHVDKKARLAAVASSWQLLPWVCPSCSFAGGLEGQECWVPISVQPPLFPCGAGGADADRHERAGGADLCAALPHQLHQGNQPVAQRGALRCGALPVVLCWDPGWLVPPLPPERGALRCGALPVVLCWDPGWLVPPLPPDVAQTGMPSLAASTPPVCHPSPAASLTPVAPTLSRSSSCPRSCLWWWSTSAQTWATCATTSRQRWAGLAAVVTMQQAVPEPPCAGAPLFGQPVYPGADAAAHCGRFACHALCERADRG